MEGRAKAIRKQSEGESMAKRTSNHWFLKVFGWRARFWAFVGATLEHIGAYWLNLPHLGAIFGFVWPAWGYLVLFGAILNHLGTILNPNPKFNDSFTFLIVFNLQRSSFK